MISLEKRQILTHLQKLPKNVGDLGITLMPKALKSCPESNKSPNLVTLTVTSNTLDRKPRHKSFTPVQIFFLYFRLFVQ